MYWWSQLRRTGGPRRTMAESKKETSGPEQNHQGYDVGQWKRKSKKKKKIDRTGGSLELDGTSRGGSALGVGLKPSRSISFGSWTDWVSGAGSGMDWVKGAGCRTDSMVAVATG